MEENNNSTSRNTNPTPQEQYQKEQLEKANFNPLDVSHSSTEDAYRRRKNKERQAQIEAWLTIAGLGGGAYGTAILVNKNPELAEFIAKLPGANRYSIKHEIAVDNSIAFGGKPTNLKGLYADQSLGRSLLSIAASIEELSPFGVLKTLQFTNILEPLTNVSREAKDVHISGSTIRSSLDYYDRLINTMSGKEKSLLESDTKRGFLLRNNQLFRYLEDGTIDEADPVLKHVRMVTTHTKMGEEISPNRLLNKFANLLGTNLGYDSYSREGTALIAGKSWKDLAMRWANAGFMHSMEIGYKTLDNPLQGVEELFKATGIPNIGKNGSLVGGIFDSNWYQSLKKKANIQLGTGGVYNTTTTDAMTRLGKNLVGKSLAAYVGYQAVNQVLDMVTPDSSAWNDGIISGLTANYANVRVGLAKVLADPFQRYKEAQENVADGSTSLITLAGFPIAGATAGASLAWYKRMKDSAFEGIEAATLDSDIKVHKYGFAQGIAEKLKLGETNLSKSWGFRGAVIGAAISLPFLPGALIGESSEDLKASYSGERKEAYRASTGWLAGSEDIKGGHIKAFVPSRVARILSDAEDEVRYNGDNKLKRQLDPIYSPFSYLKNPYAFEEMHQDDMPYPVWGMNVDYGSFLGKIYQGTVGEFIKPTIINPQFLEDSRLIRTNAIENYRQQAQLDVNRNEQQSASQTYHASKLSLAANWLGITGKSGEYPIMSFAKPNERQMIDSGMMLAEESPSSDPHTLAAAQTYNALTDFTGLKGFTTSLIVNKMGYDPTDVRRQLARSGDAVSLADDFKDANVGDALGCFTPEMRVLTSEGYKEIQHIKIGDMVLTKDNSYKPVWNIFPKYIEDVILNIKVSGIKNIIRVTKNHIIPAYVNGILVEINAEDLKQNDILIIPDGYNNYIYSEIEYIYGSIYDGFVFDLGVEDIHYYTVENVLVHNSGEFLRRIIPMGAGSNPDDVNPMLNNSANWLPSDPSKYYNDFSRGNAFNSVELGEHRLPGRGLEVYKPELKGMDPNDYPLIYQYQVLSDVAMNSPEHLSLKTYLLNADKEGKLSDTERDMFYESLTEEQAKKQRKQFSEYKSAEQFSKFSLGGKVLNTIWETAAHNAESPLEALTPFRPGAKFIHKRSAIEDYEMTMLNGPDTGIWTNPYSHFIRPAINRTAGILPGTQKPEHAEERDNVEEYFDKLEYLKARRNGRTNDVLRTVHGATAAGILDVNDFNKFSAGLSDNQRDYLQSFSKTTDSSDRRKILEMLPTDVAAGYQRIWNNLEVAEKAKKSGKDIDEAVKDAYIKSNMKELLSSRITGSNDSAQLDAAVMESKKQKAMSGQNFSRRDELLAKTRELKLREADKEAEAYVAARTGVPGEDWIGWDPRLKLDEVKLRTLQIGKADTYDYGFWDSDLKRNARIIALDDEDEVTRSYEDIKRTMRSDLLRKKDIERTMFNNGIFARRVILSDANTNNTDIRLQE